MVFTTKNEYSRLYMLPEELVYEINLMAREIYSDERKKLLRSVRSKAIEKIANEAGIMSERVRKLCGTDGTINELVNQVMITEHGWQRGVDLVFDIPMGPLLKLRYYFNNQITLNGYRI